MATKVTEPVAPVRARSKSAFSLISDHQLQQMYATMLRCRRIAETENGDSNLSTIGQEAAVVGVAIDLQPEDTVLPFRDARTARHIKGAPLKASIGADIHPHKQEWDEIAANMIPRSASVAAQLHLATAVALANKAKKNSNIVVAFLEQEAISVADFQSTLDFAAAQDLPMIFVWAHNLGMKTRPNSKLLEEISTRAQACNIPAIPVDGNDVVAVYRVAFESVQRARNGGGPTVIEAHTHRTAQGSEHDPIATMERYLDRRELFTTEWKLQLLEHFDHQLRVAAGSTP